MKNTSEILDTLIFTYEDAVEINPNAFVVKIGGAYEIVNSCCDRLVDASWSTKFDYRNFMVLVNEYVIKESKSEIYVDRGKPIKIQCDGLEVISMSCKKYWSLDGDSTVEEFNDSSIITLSQGKLNIITDDDAEILIYNVAGYTWVNSGCIMVKLNGTKSKIKTDVKSLSRFNDTFVGNEGTLFITTKLSILEKANKEVFEYSNTCKLVASDNSKKFIADLVSTVDADSILMQTSYIQELQNVISDELVVCALKFRPLNRKSVRNDFMVKDTYSINSDRVLYLRLTYPMIMATLGYYPKGAGFNTKENRAKLRKLKWLTVLSGKKAKDIFGTEHTIVKPNTTMGIGDILVVYSLAGYKVILQKK